MKTKTLILTIIKVCVDAVMSVLFLLLMGYHLLDGSTHEWLGVSLFVLFLAHNGLNYKWYAALFKGKYGVVRIIQTALNILLWVAMIGCIVSSMSISAYIFNWMNISAVGFGRKLHLMATVWAFIIMSVHLGFHWSYFIGMAKKIAKPSVRVAAILKWVFRALVIAVCLYAATVFHTRAYWEEMFLKVEFKWFDYEKSIMQYFVESLALMTMFTAIGYYLKKAIIEITIVCKKSKINKEIKTMNNGIFEKGVLAPDELAKCFSGKVWLQMLVDGGNEWNCPICNVTFEAGCINNWHSHPGGQILLVTSGRGWYQEWGKEARELHAGDVVTIPENVKHWHGAAKDSEFTHISIETNAQKGKATWLEPVDKSEYEKLK